MCKIDLPRKNMVIERERAQKRRGERLLGISTHTHTHTCTITRVQSCTDAHTRMLEGVEEKVLAWVEWKKEKNFLSCSLVLLPIKKNEVHQQ